MNLFYRDIIVQVDNCYESNKLPNQNDYMNYKSFRGNFHDTHFYMVKNPYYIKNIHYISGIRPKK